MTGPRLEALAEARKLVRTFGSAPDARRRAQAIMSELKRADGWTAAARQEIDATDAWIRAGVSASALEPRLRALLARLA
jgi:hypothetical protein